MSVEMGNEGLPDYGDVDMEDAGKVAVASKDIDRDIDDESVEGAAKKVDESRDELERNERAAFLAWRRSMAEPPRGHGYLVSMV